jgi:hypothetical protein
MKSVVAATRRLIKMKAGKLSKNAINPLVLRMRVIVIP